MRRVILITICLAPFYGLWPAGSWPLRAKLDPTVRAALEARCGDVEVSMRSTCEQGLLEDFAGGAYEPDSVLRLHCTRWTGTWGSVTEPPLPICEERYGGWITG